MTEIERKALALVREVLTERNLSEKRAVRREVSPYTEALCRAIEQHEAFKQEVSDAMKLLSEEHEAFKQEVSDALLVYQKADGLAERSLTWDALTRFIIAKPDPLVDVFAVLEAMLHYWGERCPDFDDTCPQCQAWAAYDSARAALAAMQEAGE